MSAGQLGTANASVVPDSGRTAALIGWQVWWALALFASLLTLTAGRGATDRVCGMMVDRARAEKLGFDGHTYFFCCDGCKHIFEADPGVHRHGD